MKLTSRTKYGLKLCFLIAVANDKVPLSTLVKQTGHSEKYLEQLLIMLKKGNILSADRGVNGGYRLTRRAGDISIKEILDALGDGFDLSDCAEGVCRDDYCPNKRIFMKLYTNINDTLSAISLQDMLDDYRCV